MFTENRFIRLDGHACRQFKRVKFSRRRAGAAIIRTRIRVSGRARARVSVLCVNIWPTPVTGRQPPPWRTEMKK